MIGRESTERMPTGAIYEASAKGVNWITGGSDYRKGGWSPTPEEMRYITMTIGGGLLREVEKMANAGILSAKGESVPGQQIPLAGRFAGVVDDDKVQQSRYFKNTEKIDALRSEMKLLTKNKRQPEAQDLI